jgi:hypothetical protein
MEVRIVKLISGEEVIGELVDQDPNSTDVSVSIRNVLAVMPQAGPQGPNGEQKMGFGFVPWGSLAGEDFVFTFKWAHVVYTAKPVAQIEQMYTRTFSKVQVATPSLLIPGR